MLVNLALDLKVWCGSSHLLIVFYMKLFGNVHHFTLLSHLFILIGATLWGYTVFIEMDIGYYGN